MRHGRIGMEHGSIERGAGRIFPSTQNSRTVPEPMSSTESPVVAPHPSLPRYYDESEGGKRPFVRKIFNSAAPDYNRIENLMALGWGPWYRRQALTRAGLARDMKVLDVAIGTGLVAREEITLTGDARNVV